MHKVEENREGIQKSVAELLQKTAEVLNNDVLRILLSSVQQTNLDICLESAVQRHVNHLVSLEFLTDAATASGPILASAKRRPLHLDYKLEVSPNE